MIDAVVFAGPLVSREIAGGLHDHDDLVVSLRARADRADLPVGQRAAFFAVIISTVNLILNLVNFGGRSEEDRVLKITVPEDLDFEGKFEDIFERYLTKYTVEEVKTTNMGSMYKLSYRVNMKKGESVKTLMDEIRERNGNLEVSLNRPTVKADEL